MTSSVCRSLPIALSYTPVLPERCAVVCRNYRHIYRAISAATARLQNSCTLRDPVSVRSSSKCRELPAHTSYTSRMALVQKCDVCNKPVGDKPITVGRFGILTVSTEAAWVDERYGERN
jgi:hypothetical protein